MGSVPPLDRVYGVAVVGKDRRKDVTTALLLKELDCTSIDK